MAWNGSGTYVLTPTYYPEVNGNTVDAVRYNGLMADIATGINNALAKNGENAATANIPMGGFKLTGLAAGTAAGHSVRYEQIASLAQEGDAVLTTDGTTGAVTLDSQKPNHLVAPTGNITFTFSNARASGTLTTFSVILAMGGTGYTLTWPGSVKWPGGTTPTSSGVNKTDLYSFFSRDGGTNWFGAQVVRGWAT